MKQLKLYHEYLRDEIITHLIPTGNFTEFSSGELVVGDSIGIIFAVISKPPHHSYFLSNTVFRWFSSETDIQFYSSTILSFPSNYRMSDKTLYLFAKHENVLSYIFLGSLRVIRGEIPSTHYTSEFPKHIIIEFQIDPILLPKVWAKFDWSKEKIFINGLPLPPTLLTLISQNRWPPSELAPCDEVFDTYYPNQRCAFDTPDQMERNTDNLWRIYRDGYGDDFSLCETDDESRTKLLLSKAVCLGDTGPETAFCLDYRDSTTRPCVVYLGSSAAWKVIAPDIETFARKLGL